jgi:indole-3-glycerol phosphate synthase
LAHQTISADSQGLNIFVNVELKPAIEKLRQKIRKSHSEWRKIVSELHKHSAFNLKIEERVQKQAQNYDYKPICIVESACLTDPRLADVSFKYVESLLENIPLPYLTLVTKVSRQEAIKASSTNYGRELIEKVTALMVGFHPLVEFINKS